MRVLLAPDKFKGMHTGAEVCAALAAGLEAGGVRVDRCPVADGGEGTAEVLALARGGDPVDARVAGPLGAPVAARWWRLDATTAALDLAAASGLALQAEETRDVMRASTRGTGELIAAAVDAGARDVLVGSGGSASVDGGLGALEAIEAAGGLRGARVVVLCDVTTPWERAARAFGPQKGATPQQVAELAARLDRIVDGLPRDPRGVPASGGSGGFSGALWSALGAELGPGAAFVLDAVGFDARAARADLVVVGEGRLDASTLEGKAAGEAARRAQAAGARVVAVVGAAELDPAQLGLDEVVVASTPDELEATGRALATRLRPPAA